MSLYDDERAKIRTGDIILFQGSYIGSRLIRFGTGSKYSHIGVAVKSSDGLVYCFHSSHKKGVHPEFLSNLVRDYKGKIFVRHLNRSLSDEQVGLLKAYRRKYTGMPYETSKVEFILAGIGRKFGITKSVPTAALFCSEMVCKMFQYAKMLNENYKAHTIAPCAFASSFLPELDWLENIRFSYENRIK